MQTDSNGMPQISSLHLLLSSSKQRLSESGNYFRSKATPKKPVNGMKVGRVNLIKLMKLGNIFPQFSYFLLELISKVHIYFSWIQI